MVKIAFNRLLDTNRLEKIRN